LEEPDLKLYAAPRTRSTRVLWALEEAGAEYEYVKINLFQGEGRRPPYIDLNPAGKVPALQDGDSLLTESGAICLHLADKYPDSGLLPAVGDPARAQAYRWSFFATGELEQPLWTRFKHQVALPPKVRVEGMEETCDWEFRVAMKVLAKGLGEQEYLAGDVFSVADILVGHTLLWAKFFGLSWEHENVDAYLARLTQRPAFSRVRAVEKEHS
jgi:glutathione S-transferase